MIDIKEATKIAKKTLPSVDSYKEEPKAFIFTNSKAKKDEVWDNEVVVLKATGKVISYMQYIMEVK